MPITRGKNDRTVLGNNSPNSSTEEADVIFISEFARRYQSKQGARLASMTPKGFQKLQAGDNAISYKKLTHWMRRDPELMEAYFRHVGGASLVSPDQAIAIQRAVNSIMRGGMSE